MQSTAFSHVTGHLFLRSDRAPLPAKWSRYFRARLIPDVYDWLMLPASKPYNLQDPVGRVFLGWICTVWIQILHKIP